MSYWSFEPEDTEALLIKAYALEKSDDYETAYKFCKRFIAINSDIRQQRRIALLKKQLLID